MKRVLFVLSILLLGNVIFAQPIYNSSNEAKLEYNQGVDFYKLGHYDKSMAAFRRAIELDPNYIDAYYNLGSILEYLKQDEEALVIFKQIIVRKPDDYEAVYKAANLSHKLGYTDKAKDYLALIPAESSVYSKANALAIAVGTDMQTVKSELQEDIKNPIDPNVFNNLPSPTGIVGDKNGNIYVACFSDNMIYKITPDGKKIIFIKDTKVNGPIAMVNDSLGNIYVSNYNADNVLRITPTGAISVLINNIEKPYGLYIYNGMLYVSSQGGNSVYRHKL